MNWIQAVSQLTSLNCGYVLVTILRSNGSAPRGAQSKMVVTADHTYDSVGGGRLEWAATGHARQLLVDGSPGVERLEYTLGKDLVQCCGGEVELLYELFPACDFHITLFGAGHVGQALIKILADLPCRVNWVDAREDYLLSAYHGAGKPENTTISFSPNPDQVVEQSPGHSFFLVMTHSHETDFELVEAILSRPDAGFCGLIGSGSKAASFRGRLKRKQFSEAEVARLVSPVGLSIGAGKRPMEVAVAVSAQLLSLYYSR